MRLFVAIPLPEEVKHRLGDLQQQVEGIRWLSTQQSHLTLRFIGEVEREMAEAVRERLAAIQSPPFTINLDALGGFPKSGFPRVLWVGVEREPSLLKLQEKVERACIDAGLEPDRRNFRPHITLGKVKGASRKDVLSFIHQYKLFRVENIRVSEFVLYSSRLHPEGAIHKPLERYSLERNT